VKWGMSLITVAFPAYLLVGEVRENDVSLWRSWLCIVAIAAPLLSVKAGPAIHLAALGLSVALTASLAASIEE
jgi:hypothetical protein